MMKIIRWIFLCAFILWAAHPAWTQSQPSQPKLGVVPLKFVRNNIDYQVVSFDDLYFNYGFIHHFGGSYSQF